MDNLLNYCRAIEPIINTASPIIIFVVIFFVGLLIRKILFKRLSLWASTTKTDLDDIVIESSKGPFLIWCMMFGIYFALGGSSVSDEIISALQKAIVVLGILSVTFVLSNILTKLINIYSTKASGGLPVTTLSQNIVRVLIFGIGILIILSKLGISITPLLTALGVGGLAVALALQDTLSNFFAGFYVSLAKQIRIGDYVKLENQDEGYIVDIGWRSTRIRTLPNNFVIIPNSKLSSSIVTNFHLPEKEMAVLVNVGVDYASDLEKVEKVTCEVAKEVMKKVNGGVPDFEPFIRFNKFNYFSIDFTVILRGKEFTDQYLIKHEFIKLLHKRYNKENIVIPFPIRTVIKK